MPDGLARYEGQEIDSSHFGNLVNETFVDYTPSELYRRHQDPRLKLPVIGSFAGERTDPDYKDAIDNLVNQLEHHFYTGEPVEIDLSSPGAMGNVKDDIEIYLDETYALGLEVGNWSVTEFSEHQGSKDARQAAISVEAPIEIGQDVLSTLEASARDTFVPMYEGRIGLEGCVNNNFGDNLDGLIKLLDSEDS